VADDRRGIALEPARHTADSLRQGADHFTRGLAGWRDHLLCGWRIDLGNPLFGRAPEICAGDSAAADPDGLTLLVQVMEAPKTRLVRVPVDGGAPREIPLDGPFHLTFDPVNSAGISRGGRLLVPLTTLDSWFFAPGMIDLATGRMHRIAVDHFGDYHSMAWMPDGEAAASVTGFHAPIWKFTPEGH
jgi:hypothetical protein